MAKATLPVNLGYYNVLSHKGHTENCDFLQTQLWTSVCVCVCVCVCVGCVCVCGVCVCVNVCFQSNLQFLLAPNATLHNTQLVTLQNYYQKYT